MYEIQHSYNIIVLLMDQVCQFALIIFIMMMMMMMMQ